MASGTTGYTRFVRAMRVLLPLGALAILSTLFLIAERVDLSNPFAFEDIDLSDILLQPGVTAPVFAAKTDGGEDLRLSAGEVLSFPDGSISARDVDLSISSASGAFIALRAQQGRIAVGDTEIGFEGAVRLSTDTGLSVETEQMVASRNMNEFRFPQPITATGPFGDFSAASARVERQMSQDGVASYRLLFHGGVNLLYTPQR